MTKPDVVSVVGKRWAPGAAAGAGLRWCPAAPSASLLAARALSECEMAETCNRNVHVVADKVVILSRPDVLGEVTQERLKKGNIVEVVARYVCQKDGRVYLRLKDWNGWVSTRCLDNLLRVTVTECASDQPIEPPKCSEPLQSRAVDMLPMLDQEEVEAELAVSKAAEEARAAEVIADAKKVGLGPKLKALAALPEIAKLKLPLDHVLEALKEAQGRPQQAKKALLAAGEPPPPRATAGGRGRGRGAGAAAARKEGELRQGDYVEVHGLQSEGARS